MIESLLRLRLQTPKKLHKKMVQNLELETSKNKCQNIKTTLFSDLPLLPIKTFYSRVTHHGRVFVTYAKLQVRLLVLV